MMPRSKSHATPANRVLGLYCLLLFSGREMSLTQLARALGTSKQSVLRGIETISLRQEVDLKSSKRGRERFYRINPPAKQGGFVLDPESLRGLMLCRDIVQNLLPKGLADELNHAIGAASFLLSEREAAPPEPSPVHALAKGAIDYTPFQGQLDALRRVMDTRRACTVRYRARLDEAVKAMTIAPLKLIVYHESFYIRARVLRSNGAPAYKKNINLLLHRIQKVDMTDISFDANALNDAALGNFGFDFDEPFTARIRFTGSASVTYIAERIWSPGQKIRKHRDGGITLGFTTTSLPETKAWVLGFGPDAQVLSPQHLREAVREAVAAMAARYEKPKPRPRSKARKER